LTHTARPTVKTCREDGLRVAITFVHQLVHRPIRAAVGRIGRAV